jgi:acetoin utilization protein AcuC
MSDSVALVSCPEARIYDLGPDHPLRPERVQLTWDLIDAYGLPECSNVWRVGCSSASMEDLRRIHSPDFIDATTRAGHGEDGPWGRYGFGPGDNPVFPDMHEAASLVAGASLGAAAEVAEGRAQHAFNAAGGLHHAMRERASGFCVYNDPAVAISWLLAKGFERVAYVDVDVHHGDGVQAAFWHDPRVLTISLHQYGLLFPGTGEVEELGAGEALGTKVNVPLASYTTDTGWLEALDAVVPPLVRAFGPQVLVTQLGCDSHRTDPLAQLGLTTHAYCETARALHALAHEACEGRWIATGGGGYQWARVVPRAWTIYFGEMCGAELPDELPESWIEHAERLSKGEVPATLSESPSTPTQADERVTDSIERVKAMVFPFFGL